MAVTKNFEGFENKEDVMELIDRFDKSSLFELEISIVNNKFAPAESEVKIRMIKTAVALKDDYWDTRGDAENEVDNPKDIKDTVIKMTKDKQSDKAKIITAPLVGTFYASPSPDSDAYVKVGDKVTKGMIICIIEAMKIMNEIECETEGEIAEVLVNNGSPVEYGQPLFRLK